MTAIEVLGYSALIFFFDRVFAALILPVWILSAHRKDAASWIRQSRGTERGFFIGLTILFLVVGFEGPLLLELLRFFRRR